jgi:ligand-binding sensor domain-containing protein
VNHLFAKHCVVLLLICAASSALAAPSDSSQADETRGHPPEQPVVFERLALTMEASARRVWSILQDRPGFLWLGSTNGLHRYDSHALKTFRHEAGNPHSLSSNLINVMLEDRGGSKALAGALWIGTADGGLNRFDPRTGQFLRFRHDPDNLQSLSSDHVWALCEDRSGGLWVGTRDGGLNRLIHRDDSSGTDGTTAFVRFQHDPTNPQSLSHNDVFAIHQDQTGTIWIGTYGGGLNKMILPAGEAAAGNNGSARPIFTHYRHDSANPRSLSSDNVYTICDDPFRPDVLWIGTWGGGLNRFDTKTGECRRFQHDPANPRSLSEDKVARVFVDQAHVLWAGTWGGGLNRMILSPDAGGKEKDSAAWHFSRFKSDPADPHALTHNNVVSIYEDRSGLLWIGTAGGGVNTYDRGRKPFRHYRNHPLNPNSLNENDVRSVYEARNGELWVGTQAGGLNQFDRARQRVRRFQHDPANANSLGDNTIWAILEDRQGVLWLGTFGGLDRFDHRTGKWTHYRHDPNNTNSLSENTVYALCEDRRGYLWIGTYRGLNEFNPQTEVFIHYLHDPGDSNSLSSNAILTIHEDSHRDGSKALAGTLWIGTSDGLNQFDREKGRFLRYQHDPADSLSLSHNYVWAIHQDRAGALWIGTSGGLDKLVPNDGGERWAGRFTHYTATDGLPLDVISSILEDEEGNLWLGTPQGLCKFNPQRGTFRYYGVHDGLLNSDFSGRACSQSSSGEIFLGGPEGLNAFLPAEIKDNPHVPPVVLTGIQIFNGAAAALDGQPVLQNTGGEAEALKLSYRDRVVLFEFAALNYRMPVKNRYRYMLEGFDKDWIEVDSKNRRATYSNLSPGKYTFRVIGSNNDGLWNEKGKSACDHGGAALVGNLVVSNSCLFIFGRVIGSDAFQKNEKHSPAQRRVGPRDRGAQTGGEEISGVARIRARRHDHCQCQG